MRFKEILKGEIWEDLGTGIQWSKTLGEMPWEKAMNVCENLKLGGHNDWRLPTRADVLSVIDDTIFDPTTELKDTVPSGYWSATTYANGSGYAWLVNFDYGYVSYSNKTSSYYVRAVRGGQLKILGGWQ